MNNIINLSKHDLTQTNISSVTSNVSIAIGGVDAAVATNTTGFEGLFQATFQKISDQSTFNGEAPVTEVTGNNLPVDLPLTDVFPELSAESDHVLTKQVLTTQALATNNIDIDDTNLLLSEDGHLMLNTNDGILVDEDQSLTVEPVYNRLSVTEEHVDAEQNYSVSSLIPSLSPSVMKSSSIESLTSFPDTGPSQSQNLTNTNITQPVSGSITQSVVQPVTQLGGQSVTQVELSPPLTVTSLQPAIGKTESIPTNVVISEIAGEMTKETVSRNLLNNIKHADEKVSLASSQLVSDKTLQTSVSVAVENTMTQGKVVNEIHQNLISSHISKQAVDNEVAVLQDDLVTIDEILLRSKQSLYSQKLMGNVEQYSLKTNPVAAAVSNIKFNNQQIVEQNKLDAVLLSTTTGANQTEEIASTVATINGFSPQLRAVLQTRPNTKISQLENVSVTQSENSVRLERNLMQSMDGLSLTTETSGLITDKIQNFSNTLTQQLFTTTQAVQGQAAPLLQTAQNIVDINSDSLSVTMSPTLNNVTSVNSIALPQAEITESIGRSGWSQAMGKQVLSMITQNIGSAEIRLNPAHLGPIEILIDMTEDQVNVSLTSRHAVVREAMEQALPRLREMLDENGFNLADTDISKHSFADQREQNTKHNEHATDINATTLDQLTTTEITDPVVRGTTESTGIVDYFV